jgi:hypothetical protein
MAKKKPATPEPTIQEQEKLIEILKFTPRTYKIQMWGYGGEYVMGTVDRRIYDYFRHRRLNLMDYAWDGDYAQDNNIPEDMQPFPPGSWYECDDMGHTHGVDRGAGTLQILDENEEVVYERSLEDIDGYSDDSPEWSGGDEVWIDAKPAGTVVFIGTSSEKGTFFEGELPLNMPFDITKLSLSYDEVDGNEIVNKVMYAEEEIDNSGGSTSGKSSDFGFYIAGSNKHDGKGYERYKDMDDIQYTVTDWFPAKVKPVRVGKYNVKTKDGYNYQANWNGTFWHNDWNEEKIKVTEWQGIDHDPDADDNWDAVTELQKIIDSVDFNQGVAAFELALEELGKEFDAEQPVACFSCGAEHLESDLPELNGQLFCPDCKEGWVMMDAREPEAEQTGWPFAGPAEVKENEVTESKWWTVRTHYKKSCEQHEYFVQRDGTGRIKVVDGFRFCTYNVETNDGKFPQFEFTTVPGGNAARDSLDLNSLSGSNIESSELVEMFDGGCWGDIEITGIDDEEEVERLEELINEEGAYSLEDDGDWYLEDTEVWVWGPIEVEDDEGNVRIVCADADGNMVDFVTEGPKDSEQGG